VPVYGPLGPGQTAAVIWQGATPPPTLSANGTPLQNFQNAATVLGLAGLQQAELGTLYAGYAVGGQTQPAAGAWVGAWANQASATLNIMRGLCRGQRETAERAAESSR
jgi:hypothetical protein